jgi:catalase
VNIVEKKLTTNQGVPVSNNQSSLTVGERGPVLLQDVHLIEKLAHFDRERIPERVVHAKGAGAHGFFRVYKSMENYTYAKFLRDPDMETPVFVRFSTVVGFRGSADTARDPRGFAVKFYTEDGNYDLVGNNLPVFFIRDAAKFPDMVHAFKPAPDTNINSDNRFWDFISLTPESTHMITWLYSDRGTVKS